MEESSLISAKFVDNRSEDGLQDTGEMSCDKHARGKYMHNSYIPLDLAETGAAKPNSSQ